MNNNHLLIFMRSPVLGEVKTRLAAETGDEEALLLYLTLVKHTLEVAATINCERFLCVEGDLKGFAYAENTFMFLKQSGSELGERMKNAFARSFNNGALKVIIIGTDSAEIEATHINKAFELLDSVDAVVGPAMDGGYYLLGLTRMLEPLFSGKQWSSSTVFKNTIKDLKTFNFSYCELESLSDIDTLADLERSSKFREL